MRFLAVLVLFISSVSFAAPAPKANVALKFQTGKTTQVKIDTAKIESLVKDYYVEKNQKSQVSAQNVFQSLSPRGPRPRPGDDCGPSRGMDCIDAACEKLGEYGCNEQSEIDTVITACKGVDGECLNTACSKLGEYGCNEMSEITSVAAICRKVFDRNCMEVVCKKLGEYGCNEISEIRTVGSICAGRVDASCIESVCNRLGEYGCNEMSEIQAVAKSCSGR